MNQRSERIETRAEVLWQFCRQYFVANSAAIFFGFLADRLQRRFERQFAVQISRRQFFGGKTETPKSYDDNDDASDRRLTELLKLKYKHCFMNV